MKNKIIHIFDYIFVTRPVLFFPGWTTLLLGYLVMNPARSAFVCEPPSHLLLNALISFGMVMGSAFILNQIQDKESDQINNKLFFIGKGMISPKAAYLESFLLLIGSLIIAFRINYEFVVGVLLFFIITGYFYNYPPFQWKNKPFMGLVGNILMGWLAFYFGVILEYFDVYSIVIRALPYVFLNTALYIFTTLPDALGDKESNKITLGVLLPFQVNIYIAFFLFLAGWAIAYGLHDRIAMIIYLGSTYHFVHTIWKSTMSNTIRATKWTVFISSLIVAAFFPWYLIWIIAAYIFTKAYYKARFHFDYPNFKGE